ncbi:MAG TPA: hypothetical protein PKL78_12930 [Anaerolineales bacterium]|nr:hypothetical protein [Anaerolineales bacterium]
MKLINTSHVICDHEWVVNYDPAAEADCYNDGGNYRPAEYICTRCKKKRDIKYADDMKWYQVLLSIPMFVVFFLYFGIIAPVIMLISLVIEEFSSNKK